MSHLACYLEGPNVVVELGVAMLFFFQVESEFNQFVTSFVIWLAYTQREHP